MITPIQHLAYAYAPALMAVGLLMISSIKKVDLEDLTEAVPAFATIVLMIFSYNIANGLTGGLRANYSASDLTLVSDFKGVKIAPTFGLVTTEAGGTATFAAVDGDVRDASYCSQMPAFTRSRCTCSLGWAPFASQAWTLASSMVKPDGSWRGWY